MADGGWRMADGDLLPVPVSISFQVLSGRLRTMKGWCGVVWYEVSINDKVVYLAGVRMMGG